MIQINKLRIRFTSGFSFIPFKLLQWIYTEKNSKFILFFIRVKGQEKIHMSSFTKLIFLSCCPILYCAGSASPRLDRPWPHFVIVFFPRCRSFACDFFIGSSWCWIFLWLALFCFFVLFFYFDGRTERALRAWSSLLWNPLFLLLISEVMISHLGWQENEDSGTPCF